MISMRKLSGLIRLFWAPCLFVGTVFGQSSTMSSANLISLAQSLTGCNTASYVLTPAGSNCVAAGTGTVTHTGGALTGNYVVLGNGTADTKPSTDLDDDQTAANTLTYTGTTGINASGVGAMVKAGSGAPAPTVGTSGGGIGVEGTAFTGINGDDGWYANSTNHCFDIVNGTSDAGCALTAASLFTGFGYWSAGTGGAAATATNLGALINLATSAIPKSGGTSAALVASSITDDATTVKTTETLVSTGNNVLVTSGTVTGTNTWKATGLTLPSVVASTNRVGRCEILWQMSSTSYTLTFGAYNSNAPTHLFTTVRNIYAAAGTQNFLYSDATSTSSSTPTSITAATTAGATGTTYLADMQFMIVNGASADVVTIEAESSNASGTWTIEPGSFCDWLP